MVSLASPNLNPDPVHQWILTGSEQDFNRLQLHQNLLFKSGLIKVRNAEGAEIVSLAGKITG